MKSIRRQERKVQKEYRPITGHECSLTMTEDALSMYLSNGCFVLLRRRIKKMFLISETLPKSKLFFRSSLRIGLEKQRHLRYFYYTIHPFSKFRFYWEIFMATVFLGLIIYMPLYAVNLENPLNTKWNGYYYYFLNATCVVDMFVSMCSGYVENKTENVVLNRKQITKNYLSGYFIVDAIACVPSVTICKVFEIEVLHWYLMNRYVKVFRLVTAIKYLDNLMDVINIDNQKRLVLTRLIFFFIFIEYCTLIVFFDRRWLISMLDAWPYVEKIVLKLTYCTVRTFLLIKPHFFLVHTTGWFMLAHQFILLHCGNLFNAYLIARFYAIYNRTNLISRKHERLAGQVMEFARYKELSESTHRTLLQFVDFKFGRRIYDEDLILNTLTPHLRDELFFIYSQKLMKNVELFKDMPTSAIKRISGKLKQEIMLPNDVIIQAGHEGSSMYFIIAGIVAVYTINGKEVCHLTDGANFGEIALLMNETRTASIVATDFCEVFKLQRKDFQEAIQPFPELKEKMIQTARERFTTIIAFPPNENSVAEVNEIN